MLAKKKRENQWAAYVLYKLNNTLVYPTEPFSRESDEKSPEYFSDEIGGCVPTDSHLIRYLVSLQTFINILSSYFGPMT